MRRPDEMPMDPDVLAELEVIDLTLAGEPVDPEYAELAELALMLQMERQPPREEYVRRLDARASVRFRPQPIAGDRVTQGSTPATWSARLRSWFQSAGFRVGLVGLAAAAIAVVVIANNHGTSSSGTSTSSSLSPAQAYSSGGSIASSTTAASAPATHGSRSTPSEKTAGTKGLPGSVNSSAASSGGATASGGGSTLTTPGSVGASQGSSSAAASAPGYSVPAPDTTGRKVVQSAQLTLTAANNRIDTVSQEVFNVVSQEHGIVKSSHVTSASGKRGSSAFFNLSIPSAKLETTLQDLSTLRYAHVVSRTNSTEDVTKTYRSTTHQLQDAQALRTSLLKQLAAATTQTQIDSLNAQIHDVEAQISRYQNALKSLQHRVSFSSLSVQLYSGSPPPVVTSKHGSGGFTLSSSAHDAGRVLVVAAGVILIGAAALVPVGLLGLLIYWIVDRIRRRHREEALDQA